MKDLTIEKDKDRYIKALKNVKKMGLEDRITLIFNDALEVKLKEKFDLIIIDAAKSKNLDFFSHFENNLEINGSIITDNLSFHGYVQKDLKEISSRNIRGLVKKIRSYIEFLENNIKYKILLVCKLYVKYDLYTHNCLKQCLILLSILKKNKVHFCN